MVNYQARLDRTFAALVDPTRWAILERLERRDAATVSELARPFAIKLPAVMKHLDVLDQAGLITRSKSGRTVTVRLRPTPMREAATLTHSALFSEETRRSHEEGWSGALDKLVVRFRSSPQFEARSDANFGIEDH